MQDKLPDGHRRHCPQAEAMLTHDEPLDFFHILFISNFANRLFIRALHTKFLRLQRQACLRRVWSVPHLSPRLRSRPSTNSSFSQISHLLQAAIIPKCSKSLVFLHRHLAKHILRYGAGDFSTSRSHERRALLRLRFSNILGIRRGQIEVERARSRIYEKRAMKGRSKQPIGPYRHLSKATQQFAMLLMLPVDQAL